MYSNSRLTRVFVFSHWITAFEMSFIATLCPVIVCIAPRKPRIYMWALQSKKGYIRFTFPNIPSAMSFTIVFSPSFSGGNLACISDIAVDCCEARVTAGTVKFRMGTAPANEENDSREGSPCRAETGFKAGSGRIVCALASRIW